MMGFLLDTNILSELRKANRCDAGVRLRRDFPLGELVDRNAIPRVAGLCAGRVRDRPN